MSDRDKKVIIVLGILVPIFVLYYFVYTPYAEKIENIKKENETLTQQMIKFQGIVRQKDKIEREYWAIQEKMKFLQNILPTSSEIPSLLTQIENMVKEAGIDRLNNLNPGGENPKELYDEKPISISINCDQATLSNFLYSIETSNRLLDIPNISIGSDQEGNLSVNMSLKTFMLNSEEDEKNE